MLRSFWSRPAATALHSTWPGLPLAPYSTFTAQRPEDKTVDFSLWQFFSSKCLKQQAGLPAGWFLARCWECSGVLGKAYGDSIRALWRAEWATAHVDPSILPRSNRSWKELSQDFTGCRIHSRGELRNELTLLQTRNQGHRNKHTLKKSFLIHDPSTFGVLVAVGRIHLI